MEEKNHKSTHQSLLFLWCEFSSNIKWNYAGYDTFNNAILRIVSRKNRISVNERVGLSLLFRTFYYIYGPCWYFPIIWINTEIQMCLGKCNYV